MHGEQRYRAGSALDEESHEESSNMKVPSIQKAEKVSSHAKGSKVIPSKKGKPVTKGKGKNTKTPVTSGSNAVNLGPLLSASPYTKSIEQMYKNLQALRKNTSVSTKSNNNKEEDPFLPYLAPFSAPKAPAKVNLDLKANISHYMNTSPSFNEASTDGANGFVVASGMVGEEPR